MSTEMIIALLTFNVAFFAMLGLLLLWEDYTSWKASRKANQAYLFSWYYPDTQACHCANCASDIDRLTGLHAIVYSESVNVCSVACFERLQAVWCPTPKRKKVYKSIKRFCSTVLCAVRYAFNQGKGFAMAQIQRTIGKCKLVFDKDWQEYVIKAWDSEGKRFENADYHTCDKVDAYATFAAMTMPLNEGR